MYHTPWLLLLLLPLHCSCMSCSDMEQCECAESADGYHAYCPQRDSARLSITWGEDHMVISCIEGMYSEDMLGYVVGRQMDNISRLTIKECPVTQQVLQHVVQSTVEEGLTHLVLEGAELDGDRWYDWEGVQSVTHLQILDSDGVIVGGELFDKMDKLETVVIRDNTNIEVGDEAFARLENMRNLELSNCDIRHIHRNTFANLGRLKKLQLCSTPLSSLPQGIFDDLDSLEELNLSLNSLESLPDEIFANLKQLSSLNLNFNQLKTLHDEMFKNNHRIERLEISNNALVSLPPNIFKTLTNLKHLKLSSNKLTKISPTTFQPTRQLVHLHLQHNQLQRIDLNHLGHRKSVLTSLDLSHNLLTTADIGTGIFSKLTNINLSNNHIMGRVSPTISMHCRKLKYLDLSHNNFTGTIKKRQLDVFKRNLTIDLSHNRIIRLDLTKDIRLSILSRFSSPTPSYSSVVVLTGNPLVCDCYAAHLKERILGKTKKTSGLFFHDLSCADNTLLSSWQYQDMTCTFPSSYGYISTLCTDNCSCHHSKLYRHVMVDCQGRNMTTLPHDIPIVGDGTDSVKLIMKHNRIETVDNETISHHEHFHLVDFIDLSNNKIVDIKHDVLPANLKQIILSNNNLTHFSKDTLDYFENKTRENKFDLHLGHNPYGCDCRSAEFYHFIQNYKNTSVKDYQNISLNCSNEKLLLYQSELQDFCSHLSPYLPLIIIFIIILCLLFMILICCYNKKNITIYLFSNRYASHLFPSSPLDHDKEYDAFISYSHQDAQYVEKILYPGLVRDMRYKCCIHTLHWQVGRMIPDQIVESVANSRRTIIVLSKEYIEAVWTKLEFKAAHMQAIQDKTQVL